MQNSDDDDSSQSEYDHPHAHEDAHHINFTAEGELNERHSAAVKVQAQQRGRQVRRSLAVKFDGSSSKETMSEPKHVTDGHFKPVAAGGCRSAQCARPLTLRSRRRRCGRSLRG